LQEVTNGKPKAILEDLSSNGTWVNGVIVGRNNRRELETGDEVEFAGGHKYHFRYPTGMFVSRFRDTFELGPALGAGHFATVYTAVEKKTGTQYAVKVFKKKRADTENASANKGFQQEIAMLMSVSHPNVLCLKGTYEEEDGVYLVLELAPEGELFNYIIKHQKLSESKTRKIFKQLLSGLKYLVRYKSCIAGFHPITDVSAA
jgi:serine/threonine-protein kinase Chk2